MGKEETEYIENDLVLAKVKGHPFWPAVIMEVIEIKKARKYRVYFYGTGEEALLKNADLMVYDLEDEYCKFLLHPKKLKKFNVALYEIMEENRKRLYNGCTESQSSGFGSSAACDGMKLKPAENGEEGMQNSTPCQLLNERASNEGFVYLKKQSGHDRGITAPENLVALRGLPRPDGACFSPNVSSEQACSRSHRNETSSSLRKVGPEKENEWNITTEEMVGKLLGFEVELRRALKINDMNFENAVEVLNNIATTEQWWNPEVTVFVPSFIFSLEMISRMKSHPAVMNKAREMLNYAGKFFLGAGFEETPNEAESYQETWLKNYRRKVLDQKDTPMFQMYREANEKYGINFQFFPDV